MGIKIEWKIYELATSLVASYRCKYGIK